MGDECRSHAEKTNDKVFGAKEGKLYSVNQKAEQRAEIEDHVAEFLAKGGKIKQISRYEEANEFDLRKATYQMRREKIELAEIIQNKRKKRALARHDQRETGKKTGTEWLDNT